MAIFWKSRRCGHIIRYIESLYFNQEEIKPKQAIKKPWFCVVIRNKDILTIKVSDWITSVLYFTKYLKNIFCFKIYFCLFAHTYAPLFNICGIYDSKIASVSSSYKDQIVMKT